MEGPLRHWPRCPLLTHAGSDVKWARWYSIVDKLSEMLAWWWPYTAILVLLALQKPGLAVENVRNFDLLGLGVSVLRGYWLPLSKINASPRKGIFKSMEEVVEASMKNYKSLHDRVAELNAEDGAGVGAGRGNMKDDDAAKLKQHMSILQVGAATMLAPETKSLASVICELLKPSRAEHGKSITQQKTRRGTQMLGSREVLVFFCGTFVHDMKDCPCLFATLTHASSFSTPPQETGRQHGKW